MDSMDDQPMTAGDEFLFNDDEAEGSSDDEGEEFAISTNLSTKGTGVPVEEGSLCDGVDGVIASSHEESAGQSLYVRVEDRSLLKRKGEMSVLGSWRKTLRGTTVISACSLRSVSATHMCTCLHTYLPSTHQPQRMKTGQKPPAGSYSYFLGDDHSEEDYAFYWE